MVTRDLEGLRKLIDLGGKYVEFGVLRTALSVFTVLNDSDVEITAPNKDGECRATCPKCLKPRSFSLNINTNRFNCFNKHCFLKGGGVIDFAAKLYETTAKEASHLLACAYGIAPYSPRGETDNGKRITENEAEIQRQASNLKPNEQTNSDNSENSVNSDNSENSVNSDNSANSENLVNSSVGRAEFAALEQKVERLSQIVWSMMFEKGEVEEDIFFDEPFREETVLSG